MEQFKQFNADKQAVLDSLNSLRAMLSEMSEIGIDVEQDLRKISSSIETIEDDILRIALLGAFSDGKTSMVAGWLGQVMDDMNIDTDESSNQLAIYKPNGLPDKCEIVDTPGLFGDKTLEDGQVMYEDLTKNYISEAHLVFYVVDATNPLKESHSDIARWILRDLNKLSSTIFVINKMDEVTDLTDEVLFTEQAKIKTDNLKGKLQRMAGLSGDELSALNIVCVASNPNGRGLDFWFNKLPAYESRSRINDLKKMAVDVLDSSVKDALMTKTGEDVVKNIITQKLDMASREFEELSIYRANSVQEVSRIRQDIQIGRKEIKQMGQRLCEELTAMENSLMSKLRSVSFEDIKSFLEDEIGYSEDEVGYKLQMKVKMSVDQFFEQTSSVTDKISNDISRQLDSSESFLSSVSDSALKSAGGLAKTVSKVPADVIKGGIFAARDGLRALTGFAFKFKPWQASKMAGAVSKWAGPIGAALSLASDIVSMQKAKEQEEELATIKRDISDMIKSLFKDVYDILRDDSQLFEMFAPQIKEFEKILTSLEGNVEKIDQNQMKLERLKQKLLNHSGDMAMKSLELS